MVFSLYRVKSRRSVSVRTQGGMNVGGGYQLNIGQSITKQGGILPPWWTLQDYRVSHLARRYGITRAAAARFVRRRQNAPCEICGEVKKSLCVDHDHGTGALRGLVCYRCNNLLMAAESGMMDLVQAYLGRHGKG